MSRIGGDPGDICEYSLSGDSARPVTPPPANGVPTSGTISYLLEMTNGKVTITLDRTKAPCTVNSFVSLADQGYFDNTKCHRLADSGIFVLQCGDPTGTGKGGPGYEFANETDGTESYTEGVVAMANGGPGTNGSQFFLVWADSTSLDQTPNFTIFGEMDKASRDVVASMAGEGQDGSNADGTGRPNNPCADCDCHEGLKLLRGWLSGAWRDGCGSHPAGWCRVPGKRGESSAERRTLWAYGFQDL